MKNSFFERRPHVGAAVDTEKVYEDTGTEKSYGELSWSNKQILCDTLQNSLDAETRKYISQIEANHIINAEENLAKASEDLNWKQSYLDLLNQLYILSCRAGDLDTIEKSKLTTSIHKHAEDLDVKLVDVDVEHFENSERPDLPQLTYAVRDGESGKVIRGLSQDDLTKDPYTDSERYQLFEFSISDAGSGYDVTKSVLYLPTKKGEQFSRGIFGEGLKVNQAAIARVPEVTLRMHSQYEEENGDPVAWVRHVKTEGDMVVQHGRNARHQVMPRTGSGTTIRFQKYQDENKELCQVLDPRITPVESVAAEFGEVNFKYPLAIQDNGVVYPGISLQDASKQYLQGLSIGTPNEPLLFSYDFHNRDVISGRDRNHLRGDVMQNEVLHFWEHITDPSLYRELLQRLLFSDSPRFTPERTVFFNACKRVQDGESTEQDELLLEELAQIMKLSTDVPNYIAPHADGNVSLFDPNSINVVQLRMSCTRKELDYIQYALVLHNPELTFFKVPEVKQEVSVSTAKKEKEREYTVEERIFMEEFTQIFNDIKMECEDVLRVFERTHGSTPINPVIQFKFQSWRYEMGFGVKEDNDVRTITCHLPEDKKNPGKVPDLTNQEILSKIKAEMQVLYLATIMLGRGGFDNTDRAYKEYAQKAAQELLEASMTYSPYSLEPLSHLHGEATVLMEEQMKGIRKQKEREVLEDTVVQYKKVASRLSCVPEELLDIGRWAEGEHSEVLGSDNLRSIVQERVIVEGGIASFLAKDVSDQLVLQQVELTDTNKISEWSGYPVHRVSDFRFVIPVPTQEGATLAVQNRSLSTQAYAICNDSVVYISTSSHYVDDVLLQRESFHLDRGCICFNDIDYLEVMQKYKYSAIPQERAPEDMSIEVGLMKSPVTLEYISEHWSDPERIMQDLGQNHMDAGGFEERYLVVRNEERVWVNKDDLKDSQILGYELSDKGLGYSPSGISNMGHTRKRNPFLTGKNGEGLKLAAASAKKNGFNIMFASFGENSNGEEVAWKADVRTLDEVYTHEGKTNHARRLAFQIDTESKEILGEKSALTRLELPENADTTSCEQWEKWTECIDPRNKDSMGNGGIDRILIINEGSQGSYDTVGPTTVLYDRPGAIFENGMLVRTTSQDDRTFRLGWDFPSITSTRERTHIDVKMAQAYIKHYFEHTTDERAVTYLLSSIQIHNINDYEIRWSDDEFSSIVEVANKLLEKRDVDASWALPSHRDYPSLKLFQKIAKRLYPDKILFSYEYAKERGIPMNGSMRHILEEDRLNVSKDDYEHLRKIFPTMETFLNDVRKSKIDIDKKSLSPLRNLVGNEIDRIITSIDRMRSNPSTASLFDYILRESGTSVRALYSRLNALRPQASAGKENDVFIMADDSSADGLASEGVGLRVSLLNPYNRNAKSRLLGVLGHELSHKMLEATDYTDEFILLLFLLAKDALSENELIDRHKRTSKQKIRTDIH